MFQYVILSRQDFWCNEHFLKYVSYTKCNFITTLIVKYLKDVYKLSQNVKHHISIKKYTQYSSLQNKTCMHISKFK